MKVELIRPHTHDGIEYKPGDILELNDELAAWLIKNKIATICYCEERRDEAISEIATPSSRNDRKKRR